MKTLSEILKKNINKTVVSSDFSFGENPKITSDSLFSLIESISNAGKEISRIIYNPENKSLSREIGEKNTDGDNQKELDVIADNIIENNLRNNFVKWYASEEREEILKLDQGGCYSVLVDPLDGSSNINTNAPIGTIFGIYTAFESAENSIFQKGKDLLAAGFFLYGPRTILILSIGNGTMAFQLSENNKFILINEKIEIEDETNEFSINMSNYRQWNDDLKTYINSCLEGVEGDRQKNFNMRWIGSLVADAWRIFSRGGIFLYTEDKREGYESGRLRLLYEANPISFLVEQAGGKSTNGNQSILSIKPMDLHQRTPLVFGSKKEVQIYEDTKNNDKKLSSHKIKLL